MDGLQINFEFSLRSVALNISPPGNITRDKRFHSVALVPSKFFFHFVPEKLLLSLTLYAKTFGIKVKDA
jgi:hypothetical protein